MGTIYISDLDGTLLNDNARLSDFSREILNDLLLNHLPFTVASARSVISMQNILSGIKLHLPVIEFNGAFISDLETGHHYVVNNINSAIVTEIYKLIIDSGFIPFISTFNGTRDLLYYSRILNDGMKWYIEDRQNYNDPRLYSASNLESSLKDNVVCLTVIDRQEHLFILEEEIKKQYDGLIETHFFENPYSPGWYWLTIHDYRATKDQAIKVLLDKWDHGDSKLVVFGDEINDLKNVPFFQPSNCSIKC